MLRLHFAGRHRSEKWSENGTLQVATARKQLSEVWVWNMFFGHTSPVGEEFPPYWQQVTPWHRLAWSLSCCDQQCFTWPIAGKCEHALPRRRKWGDLRYACAVRCTACLPQPQQKGPPHLPLALTKDKHGTRHKAQSFIRGTVRSLSSLQRDVQVNHKWLSFLHLLTTFETCHNNFASSVHRRSEANFHTAGSCCCLAGAAWSVWAKFLLWAVQAKIQSVALARKTWVQLIRLQRADEGS